jgi:hypothetical protein
MGCMNECLCHPQNVYVGALLLKGGAVETCLGHEDSSPWMGPVSQQKEA